MPPELRPHLFALYAFARSADDFADEPEYEGRRIEALDRWEEALHRCCHGEADHPVFVALADTIEKRDLPIPPLEDMLAAFRMDLDVRRYATFAGAARLHGALGRAGRPPAAGAVRLPRRRAGALRRRDVDGAAARPTSGRTSPADAARDRIYLPAEDLHFFGVTEADIKALKPDAARCAICIRYEVARTRALYERAARCSTSWARDLRLELTLIWLVGTTILDKIEAADYDVFTQRPTIRRRDQAVIMARAAKEWATHLDLKALKALWP